MNVTLNMLICLREGQTVPWRVLRCRARARHWWLAVKANGRVAGRGQARELMERVLAEAAGDVPAHSSYVDLFN